MSIVQFNIENLESLKELISCLEEDSYKQRLEILSGSSIGGHVRHVIEFYIAVIGASNGKINYDGRERNKRIENEKRFALISIDGIIAELGKIKHDDHVTVQANFSKENVSVLFFGSTVFRELAYCLEHSVHHEALIKVGVKELGMEQILETHFGVAASTIRYNETS